MGFPIKFVDWIRLCITRYMFSIKINGSLEGYFQGKSGLRQGDPTSPYLFVIAMEVFTSCINRRTATEDFSYHWGTEEVGLSHLIFADDVLLLCKGELHSVNKLMIAIKEFADMSGFHLNADKSMCFFGNVSIPVADSIVLSTGFQRGNLSITYLGLPLIAYKLKDDDCIPLVSRFCARVEVWTSKFLNFAGRLQLTKTILIGIAGYWCMYLFLPKRVLKKLNSIMFKFLWGGFYKPNGKCHYKVNWIDCCSSKEAGGLGLRNIYEWNSAAILYQLWPIIQQNSSSIWVRWFHKCFFLK